MYVERSENEDRRERKRGREDNKLG